MLRLTAGGHFDATPVLVEVLEAEAETGHPRRSRRMGRTSAVAAGKAFALLRTAGRRGWGAGNCPQRRGRRAAPMAGRDLGCPAAFMSELAGRRVPGAWPVTSVLPELLSSSFLWVSDRFVMPP